mgnify:CR=1 FL=1
MRLDRGQRDTLTKFVRFCDAVNGPISRPLLFPHSAFYSVPVTTENRPADYVDTAGLEKNEKEHTSYTVVLKWKEEIERIPNAPPCSSRLLFSFCLKVLLLGNSHS